MSKKLTLTEVRKNNKKYKDKERIELKDGMHVFIYSNFSKKDIRDLLAEIIVEFRDNPKAFKKINFTDWASFSLLYKFADLGIPSVFSKKVLAFNDLLTYDYFEDILSAFPEESIKKYEEMMRTLQLNIDKLSEAKEADFIAKINEVLADNVEKANEEEVNQEKAQ